MVEKRPERPSGQRKAGRRAVPVPQEKLQTIHFGRRNLILFGSGILAIGLGYLVLAMGEITLAPILLLAGYLVLIPWALIAREKKPKVPSEPAAVRPPDTSGRPGE